MSTLAEHDAAMTPGPWEESHSFVYRAADAEINAAAFGATTGGRFLASAMGPPGVRYPNAAGIADLRNALPLVVAALVAADKFDRRGTPDDFGDLHAALDALRERGWL